MRKLFCIFLALIMIFTSCSCIAAAYDFTAQEMCDYPIIMVPGYSSTQLFLRDEQGNKEHVWGIDTDLILQRVLANIVKLGRGLGELTLGNAQYIADTVGSEFTAMFEKMRCNPDGSSAYPLERYRATAEEINSYNLLNIYNEPSFVHEGDIMGEVANYIGNKNVYNFTCDFRMGAEFCATQLDECIQSVKEYSGKDKVILFAVSHGGQVSATYLALYGYKQDVHKAVLTIPAIGGAGLAYDLMSGKAELDEEMLMRYIQHGMRWEDDYDWILKAQQCGFLDGVIKALIPYVRQIAGYWGSIWDFIPTPYYEECKNLLLDKTQSAALIEKSDRFHYDILANMSQSLQECIDNGINVSIMAGTGNGIVTGLKANSDGIVPTNASTGATCAPLGKRFADGYVQVNDCGGKYKVSPSMEVDASTAYLPDNTWFIEDYYHGMTYWDNYTKDLFMNLLLTDRIEDVYSDAKFPQFRDTTNPSHAVFAEFDGAPSGYISGNTSKLSVSNCCWEGTVKILAVNIAGADLKVNITSANRKLAPGESAVYELSGEIPQLSGKLATVTVSYIIEGSVTPVGERIQGFTIQNGNRVEQSGEYAGSLTVEPEENEILSPIELGSFKEAIQTFFAMLMKIFYYWKQLIFAK